MLWLIKYKVRVSIRYLLYIVHIISPRGSYPSNKLLVKINAKGQRKNIICDRWHEHLEEGGCNQSLGPRVFVWERGPARFFLDFSPRKFGSSWYVWRPDSNSVCSHSLSLSLTTWDLDTNFEGFAPST